MRRFARSLALAVTASSALLALPAVAGPQTVALGNCFADHTTGKDRKDLARWVFVAVAAHPAIRDLSTVTPAIQDASNQTAADLFTRLLTVDCRDATRAAVKADGSTAIRGAFESLGQLAMQELMSDKSVTDVMSGLERHVDRKKFADVLDPR